MEKRQIEFNIRSVGAGDDRTIEGYASVFNDTYTAIGTHWGDTIYERICKGAFTKTLADESRNKFMLINHDWNKVVGRTGSNLVLNEDEHGLKVNLTVPNTSDGNDLLENVRLGLICGMSFGFNIKDQITRWDEQDNYYRDITEVDLFEVTATPIPAYDDTEINCRCDVNLKELRKDLNKKDPSDVSRETLKRSSNILKTFLDGLSK